jgi:hypothetical protein
MNRTNRLLAIGLEPQGIGTGLGGAGDVARRQPLPQLRRPSRGRQRPLPCRDVRAAPPGQGAVRSREPDQVEPPDPAALMS